MKDVIKIIKEAPINVLLILVWCDDFLLQYVRLVVQRLPFIGAFSEYVIPIIYAVAIIMSVRSIALCGSDLIFLLGALTVYIASPIIHPETSIYWDNYCLGFLTIVLPFYIIGISIVPNVNVDETSKLLYQLSVLTLVLKLLYFAVQGPTASQETIAEGDMAQAYKLLPHICLLAYYLIKNPSMFKGVLFCISSTYLVFLGNRGSVLILAISCVVLFIFVSRNKYALHISCAIAIAVCLFLYSPVFETTMDFLQNASAELGMSTRIFDLTDDGTLANSTGRENKFVVLFDELEKRPLSGYGVYGDRQFLDGYCHNLPLELWTDFGYFFGSIIFAGVVLILFRALKITRSTEFFPLLVCLMGNGFLKLFFSGSYLTEDTFYLLLGLSVAVVRYRGNIVHYEAFNKKKAY